MKMPIEFVVQLIHHNQYPDELQLPDVFEEEAYTRNKHLYLTGIARNQKKLMYSDQDLEFMRSELKDGISLLRRT